MGIAQVPNRQADSEAPMFLPAGFMLIGSDVKLNSPSSLVGQSLAEILQHPERARDALRVLLHLVSGGQVEGMEGVECRTQPGTSASLHCQSQEHWPAAFTLVSLPWAPSLPARS